jgi:hypothetical protein
MTVERYGTPVRDAFDHHGHYAEPEDLMTSYLAGSIPDPFENQSLR